MMSISAIHIFYNSEHFIRSSCEGNKKISDSFTLSLALAKTDRILQCNQHRNMSDRVEIAVAEVAGQQLHRLKIRISCC